MSAIPEKIRVEPEAKPRTRKERSAGPRIAGGTGDSRRIAAAILEVLGGARLPSDAATSLGVSQARYYSLESRALEGLVQACEPRPRGRQRSPESQAVSLGREVARLTRENARLQALVRVARRAIGLSEAPAKKQVPGRKRRMKKPSARALRAVAVLKATLPSEAPAPPLP